MVMVKERLKFYADTTQAKNQYFCWELSSILTLKEALHRFFSKGWYIRSAWYEKIDTDTGETENIKLNVPDLFSEFVEETRLIRPKK
jgi:hypothetical protein